MKRTILYIHLFWMMLWSLHIFAQPPASYKELQVGQIKGVVLDAVLKTPVEYATVSIYRKTDSSLVTGCITSQNGSFQIRKMNPGKYYLEVSFIGYHKNEIDNVIIDNADRFVDLHQILLRPASESLGEVVVTSERTSVQYQIDKKVVPVGKQHVAASGNAVDVLENVPSISVDIEGNVNLRGSSSFTVLIDGRPTVLEPNDALQQMPASAIENIEIITNPSAKYDPEGTAGIINIITKKGKLKGMSGLVNLNGGLYNNYGGDVFWGLSHKKFNVYMGADYNNRVSPNKSKTINRTLVDGNIYNVVSTGDFDREFAQYIVRTGVDFQMDSSNLISVGLRYGGRILLMNSLLDYEEWADPDEQRLLYNSFHDFDLNMDFLSANLNFQHDFALKGHSLKGELVYISLDGDEKSVNRLTSSAGQIASGKRSIEKGPSYRWRWKMDYVLPLGGKSRFEAGYQGQYRERDDINEEYDYDTDLNDYVYQSRYSHSSFYDQEIHSIYSLYVVERGKLGYQVGMRGEYTNRNISLDGDSLKYTLDRWDFFPTTHLSYNFDEENQLMASYTRRIQRPRGWYLEPFIIWTDAYNVRKGNPALKPEYIDSYELGYLKRIGSHMISLEGYYRVTHNKIERVRSVYQKNVMLQSMANVGKDFSLGTELFISLGVMKWWKSDIIGNLFNYKQEGVLFEADFSQESLTWSLRNNNTFKIDPSCRLQLTLYYSGPTDWAQGRREGFLITNAALRKDFFKRKFSATLQIRDIFSTSKHETTYEGNDFYSYSLMEHKTPIVKLNLSFKINNYKSERKQNEREKRMDAEIDM